LIFLGKTREKTAWFPNQNVEQAEENKVDQEPQQKEMALVVDLDTSCKEVWKKNLSWQATNKLLEQKRRKKNRSEARDLKGPGT
jgi:hypothetical protein